MAGISRWAKVGRLASRMAGSEVRERVRGALRGRGDHARARAAARVAQARQLAEGLSKLKGAAMKVGQQAAMLAAKLDLPEDVQEALSTLHSEAEPVPFPVIQATLRAELDQPLDSLFAFIDPSPLGTASLAQAHAARLRDGQDVVVKVQHEGIADAVASDLLALRALLAGGRALGRDKAELDDLYAEMKARLSEELDYLNEAVNLQQFHEVYGRDPRFHFPRHHPALCTERVLTMDRIHGRPLQAFAADASPEALQHAAFNLADLFLEMAFRHRLLHADPHPGNYLFHDDGTIGVIDFGCVKRFSPFWMGTYARLVLAALDRDDDGVLQAARDLDAWTGNDPGAGEVILAFCDAVLEPLRDGKSHRIGADEEIMTRVRPIVERMWRYPEIRGPRDIVFLHRALGGMYTLAQPTGVSAPWGERMRPHLEYAIRVAEGRGT